MGWIWLLGDSLSARGNTVSYAITKEKKRSGSPGDLLAQKLLAAGAGIVRVNARVGRSARSFLRQEKGAEIIKAEGAIANDAVVFLGTNDAALGVDDIDDFVEIQKYLIKNGITRVVFIGPPSFALGVKSAGGLEMAPAADALVRRMAETFGSSFLDSRPLTPGYGRAKDGIHFTQAGAEPYAAALAAALIPALDLPGNPGLSGDPAVGLLAAAAGVAAVLVVMKNRGKRSKR